MRRRAATALVVAAVAAVAVAALVDAVRPRPATPLDGAAAAALSELGVSGTLIYTDPECRLRALALPDLTPARLPESEAVGCEISVSPDGTRVAPAGARWSPDGQRYAICRATRVDVLPGRESYDGCAPAWRPDGALTLAREGDIRLARPERILVPRSELARAASAHPNAPPGAPVDGVVVRELAWTPVGDLVARFSARHGEVETATVAGFSAGRLAWQRPFAGSSERLLAARGGTVRPASLDRYFGQPGRFAPRRAADWSPDGFRLATGTGTSVRILDLRTARSVRIPLAVRDLAWR